MASTSAEKKYSREYYKKMLNIDAKELKIEKNTITTIKSHKMPMLVNTIEKIQNIVSIRLSMR